MTHCFYKSFLGLSNKWDQNTKYLTVSCWHVLYKQWFCKFYKVYEDYIKFDKNIAYVQTIIFIKTILENLYKFLLDPYILVARTQSIFFFNGRWVLGNFWHLCCNIFCNILRKKFEIILFRSLTLTSENAPKIGPPIMEKEPFKKWKFWSFWRLLFQ